MNFVGDENLDAPIVAMLRLNGHTVFYVAEENPSLPDPEVLKLAQQQKAVLVTMDKDFGELVFRLKQAHEGVILVRLPGKKPRERAELVLQAVTRHGEELRNAFTVVYENFVKIRH